MTEGNPLTLSNRKGNVNAALGVFAMILMACLLAFMLIFHVDANAKERSHLENLIAANYPVDAIGWTKPIGFGGKSFTLSTGGVVHRCGGITEENLLARKQIVCTDGEIINAKP